MLVKSQSVTGPISERLVAATLVAFFGVLLIYGAGLAQSQVLHNAAHDARHANGFPCH